MEFRSHSAGAGIIGWTPPDPVAIPAGEQKKESAGKPGSVEDDHSSGTPVTERLMRPTRRHLRAAGCQRHVSLFGLAPEGVCRAIFVTEDAVRSYRTFSTLPAARASLAP